MTLKQRLSYEKNYKNSLLMVNFFYESILQHVPPELREIQETHPISDENGHTRTLGLEWNVTTDQFRLTIEELPSVENVTKRIL